MRVSDRADVESPEHVVLLTSTSVMNVIGGHASEHATHVHGIAN